VPVPKQRNSRDENEAVKAGRMPQAWNRKPAKPIFDSGIY
jgi:hypothetical protein